MIVKPNKWVSVPDESGCGILEATVYGESAALPIPIETQDAGNTTNSSPPMR